MDWDDEDKVRESPLQERAELHTQIRKLRDHADEVRSEISTMKERVTELEAQREARVKTLVQKRTRRRIVATVAGLVIVIGGGIGVWLYASYVESEMIRGRVIAVEGDAPAHVDDDCMVAIEPGSFPYNTYITVTCGNRRLYGYDSFGYIKCDMENGRATRCQDGGPIREDGDPNLSLRRSANRLHLDDGQRWSIDVELLGPPGAPAHPG